MVMVLFRERSTLERVTFMFYRIYRMIEDNFGIKGGVRRSLKIFNVDGMGLRSFSFFETNEFIFVFSFLCV